MRGFSLPTPAKITDTLLRRWAQILREADRQNLKRNQDVEVGGGAKLVLYATDGNRWEVRVKADGTLTTVRLADGLGTFTQPHESFDSNFDGNFN